MSPGLLITEGLLPSAPPTWGPTGVLVVIVPAGWPVFASGKLAGAFRVTVAVVETLGEVPLFSGRIAPFIFGLLVLLTSLGVGECNAST